MQLPKDRQRLLPVVSPVFFNPFCKAGAKRRQRLCPALVFNGQQFILERAFFLAFVKAHPAAAAQAKVHVADLEGVDRFRAEGVRIVVFEELLEDVVGPDEAGLVLAAHGVDDAQAQLLGKALDALDRDAAFLVDSGVFSSQLIERWIAKKRDEQREVSVRTHPYEVELYYDL